MRIVDLPNHLEDDCRDLFAQVRPTDKWERYPHMLVAVDESYPYFLGYTGYAWHEGEPWTKAIILLDTAVAEEARGRGVASALMQARLDIAQKVGARVALGVTTKKNKPMRAILSNFGFMESGPAPAVLGGTLYMKILSEAIR